MNSTQKPVKQDRSPKSEPSKKSPTTPDVKEAAEKMQQAMDLLEPVLNFHQAVEEASKDDLRIYWDVRVVRGKDTPFAQTKGTSSLPKMLAPNMVANAPARIQQEIAEKIMEPLTADMQTEAERQTFERLDRQNKADGRDGEADCPGEESGE